MAAVVETSRAGPAEAAPGGAGIGLREVTPPWAPGADLLGHSHQGRPISLYRVGNPRATRTVVVVGSLHGSEPAGIPIALGLTAMTAPPGVRLVVVPTANPDGDALRRRQNARGVDLNRNFPGGVHRSTPGDTYYPGPRDLSEVESRLMAGLLAELRPAALVVYHQAMNLVDHCGGDPALTRRYAAETGMRAARLPRYPGSMATWLHGAQPACTILTVELPARVSATVRSRHRTAVLRLAARVGAA